MPVTLQLANNVRSSGREGMNVGEIAATLSRSETDIMETLRMLGLPLPGERAEFGAHTPSDEERAALRGKMPEAMARPKGQGIDRGRQPFADHPFGRLRVCQGQSHNRRMAPD